ncbi:transposase [Metabacillus litoralis]|uniref:transposase n=1 Tax=Metabacillus litoralis TaxID=152268 RepID=UPI001CFDC734|nr:transposase [Metabacillus litoralis]
MMNIVFILGSIATPILMVVLYKISYKFQIYFHILAFLSVLIFGNIASIAIHNIIKDDKVFMTNIHGVFLNPYFLCTGAYLGIYLLYLIIIGILHDVEYRKNK